MGQLAVTRLTKSQVITIPSLASASATSEIDTELEEFRQKMRTTLDGWRSGRMSASACASECERLYEEAIGNVATIIADDEDGKWRGNVPYGSSVPESLGRAFCMTALSAICEASFCQVLGQDGELSKAVRLLSFFYKDLGGDWQSFIEAAKALADMVIEGESSALEQESPAVKSEFQSLCRPFLAAIFDHEALIPSKDRSDL